MSTSSSKAEREKLQLIQEKSQQILTELLKDEDNKYCVDCDAKGPRWASWNLGVFLCIRCAGIHRNMGVHISKVKSVNLDSWSAEQVAYMQLMGNSKARAVYEANLPDNFKRPQADSLLEQFVRAKYEHKKYIAKEWVEPPTPKPAFDIEEERKKDKEKKRNKIIKTQTNSTIVEVQTNPVPRPHSSGALNNDKNGTNCIKLPSSDLLGLNTASNQIASSVKSNTSSLNDDDQFDAFVSCAPVLTTTSSASTKKDNLVDINETNKTTATKTNEEEDFFNQKAPEKKILDKESILKLYETSTNNNLNQAQSNLFNLNTQQPLQPVNNGGFNTNPLLVPTNGQQIINPLQPNNQTNLFQSTTQSTVNNGFAKFNNQSANLIQQPFLPFNQTSNPITTNPFLTPATNPIAPVTNGTSSTDLFSSINTNLSATKNLETQLNGLNLTNTDTFNWPSTTTTNGNISVGQSLFSANFDNLNTDKKLNTNGLSTPLTNNISPANPFLNNTIQPTIQPANNLDILSSFNTNGLNNKATNDLDNNWSNFSSATTNNTLTADIWQ